MVRAGNRERLGGLAKTGYCAALDQYFHGVKEHLIVSPKGHILCIVETPGNRHDVNGLYALLRESFRGHLIGDNAYWPKDKMRKELAAHGITITADTRDNWKIKLTPKEKEWLQHRSPIERYISQFDQQFHAHRTRNRNPQHYLARRWTKAVAYNSSRLLNHRFQLPSESYLHFHLAAYAA